jgi:hypothetical protein
MGEDAHVRVKGLLRESMGCPDKLVVTLLNN